MSGAFQSKPVSLPRMVLTDAVWYPQGGALVTANVTIAYFAPDPDEEEVA